MFLIPWRRRWAWDVTVPAMIAVMVGASTAAGCVADTRCGPPTARVERVIDGDTILLEGGERVRYLLVDAPEMSQSGSECYAAEATRFNVDMVEHRTIALVYDRECRDGYDRLLAYVFVGDLEINAALVERGYACVLRIPPNGREREDEFRALVNEAKQAGRGMWGSCQSVPCGR